MHDGCILCDPIIRRSVTVPRFEVRVRLKSPAEIWARAAIGYQCELEREGSPQPGLRLPQANCHANPIR